MERLGVRAALARLSPEVKRWMFLLPIGTVIMLAGVAVLFFSVVSSHTDSGKIQRIAPAVILGDTLVAVGAAVCAIPVGAVRVVVRRRTRLAAAKAKERETVRRASTAPSERELAVIAQAEAALLVVVRDIEATTPLRESSRVQRYVDWVAETPPNYPASLGAGRDDPSAWSDQDEDDVPVVACHWGGHPFAVNGEQPTGELVIGIAEQLQDDVIDEMWAAWPTCPGHEHPMSPGLQEGVAVWRCPGEGALAVPIGQLGEKTDRPSGGPTAGVAGQGCPRRLADLKGHPSAPTPGCLWEWPVATSADIRSPCSASRVRIRESAPTGL